jgi:excisionase family DNA binding protein
MATGPIPTTPLAKQDAATASDSLSKRRTLTVSEAAEVLGISKSTAYECVRTGELKALRFRGRIVIPAHVITELVGEVA